MKKVTRPRLMYELTIAACLADIDFGMSKAVYVGNGKYDNITEMELTAVETMVMDDIAKATARFLRKTITYNEYEKSKAVYLKCRTCIMNTWGSGLMKKTSKIECYWNKWIDMYCLVGTTSTYETLEELQCDYPLKKIVVIQMPDGITPDYDGKAW